MTLLDLVGVPDWAEPLLSGERGLALLLLVVAFAPLPSEVVLPVAGFLARSGAVGYAPVFGASVAGAYVLALVLYALGARLGLERGITALSRLPLVDRTDLERAARWFERHGRPSVFFGRLLPGVRSFISLPAGAARMPLTTFSVLTLAGTALWNGLLIGLGAILGGDYWLVQRFSSIFTYVCYACLVVLVAWLVLRRLQRRRPVEK
jgi:membrane protein DedA with SNARE-associated domain